MVFLVTFIPMASRILFTIFHLGFLVPQPVDAPLY